MIDYHLHAKTITAARTFIEYVSKKYKDENNVISFSQHEDLDLYNSYPLIDFGNRFGITIIKSVSFRSSENIEFNILDPNKDVEDLLNEAIEEKTNRIIHILKGLNNFDIFISPKQILEKLGKTDLLDTHLADIEDISVLMVENGYCENTHIAYNMYLRQVLVPRTFPSTEELLVKLIGNKIFINNPIEFIKYIKRTGKNILNKIDGFIMDVNSNKYMNIKSTTVMNGSGKLIE